MTSCTINILIVFTIYLGFVLFPSNGFKVIQPQSQTVNPDGSALISCEHNANGSTVVDVRLNNVSLTGSTQSVLCQKGQKKYCKNIVMYPENHNKYLFIILNIEEEAMNILYECEITVEKEDLDFTERGTPTRLLPGQRETKYVPHPPPPAQSHLLWWMLIGLLALMFLYSCVITSFYIKLRISSNDPENSTYVEMRKGPVPRNRDYDIYCG
ncbi:uncharacterized protein LOC121907275 [Thunnus maccoyii]|uniref:uncharacterized protein LOC121907275 n=1 Tax=Thunnus maccoyii TaxID=8240 RepID=UPI001C4C3C15|nr:uncharacterized protein LOC121907275 [Thunnus maccoyii]XP_042282673.1 uncharacterized protein LOC121907275 [Thunnus maccoyii]